MLRNFLTIIEILASTLKCIRGIHGGQVIQDSVLSLPWTQYQSLSRGTKIPQVTQCGQKQTERIA